jgi:hypothetical protein
MSATNTFETALLGLIFENTAVAHVGNGAGLQPSGVDGDFYISLHTADPGEAGSQSTSEATYTGYARVAVARGAGTWTVSGNNASNDAAIVFGACTGGTNTVTHFGIGSSASGSGHLFIKGAVTAPLAVSSGVTPEFAAGDLDVTLD